MDMVSKNDKLSFLDLMKQIDEEERTERDRGTLFEILTKVYLENEPMYRQLFDSVWLLKDVPEEYGIPKKDTGVDLVAKRRNSNQLFAIQSKYYSPDYKIGKSDIDSFLNEVGKKYYSEGIIFTSTPHWTDNAEEAIRERDKNIARIDLTQLKDSRVDWSKFSFNEPEEVELHTPKTPRRHQKDAVDAVIEGFKSADRGKLIMAPGTGKTYTSMVIAEELAEKKADTFKVLYLVPSIQLLSQALKGWSADTKYTMDTIAVCSDRKVTKQTGSTPLEDIAAADIGYPATTDYNKLLKYQEDIEGTSSKGDMLVIFSTYQSIDVVSEAQKNGFYDFDLIIADEAHRTTGATEAGEEDSHFVKVHSNSNIKAEKRLYQTATPRVYGERAHQKADETSVLLYDMDEPKTYGEEFYYLGFGEAVHRGILSDYKVMVLAVDEGMVQKEMQHVFADENNELQFDDVTKIIGTWNGLLKRKSNSNELYGEPMKRAIAFTGTIKKSKQITNMYQKIINEYVGDENAADAYKVDIQHADGTMNALEKNQKLDWLRAEVPENTVKILSNARFLTEGVDVPDLDAVLFLQPRKSEIDIAQAVGRVMRKSDNKEYGYVILPIGVPEGISANQVLDDNEKYAVVWDILNALRSIDERFDAMINKLELNKKKPDKITAIGIGDAPEVNEETGDYLVEERNEQLELELDGEWSELERAIYGKIVQKVGTTRYWESWSKDVAKIAKQHITRINALLESEEGTSKLFEEFLESLRYNINDSITQDSAVEMLAQHMITKPVFDALFEEESFALNNPVSKAMNKMVERLQELGFNKSTEELEGFYESVRLRAEGIDNLEAKQKIIVELYEKFFKEAFPKTTDNLGIVFTPIEVVDFIIQSVSDVLKKYFGKTLSDKNVNILDPFTGTGTFITRLIQSGLIKKGDLLRKYTQEIYANEIVLLSYYIAAINIEETFKEINKKVNDDDKYYPFEGSVLTDTFESTEQEATLDNDMFGDNNERLNRQKEAPITIIMGNPPYSIGASSDSLSSQNNKYPKLDRSIELSYAEYSTSTSLRSLYDPYIRAFKWSSDRIQGKGIIGFVTNGSFIDNQAMDGLRKCWYKEFNHIYIYNLRGNARTQGEIRRKEAGNIFGSGSRAPIAITILVKDGSDNHEIHYNEVDDYLTREDKLNLVSNYGSIKNVDWTKIVPDSNNDWINQRSDDFNNFKSINEDYFYIQSLGIGTSRDIWVYNYSRNKAIENANKLIDNYNDEVNRLKNYTGDNKLSEVNTNPKYINWSRKLRKIFSDSKYIENTYKTTLVSYRPFVKKHLVYNKDILENPGRIKDIFGENNKVIMVSGKSTSKEFSTIVIDHLPDLNILNASPKAFAIFNNDITNEYRLIPDDNFNITDEIANELSLTKEEVFSYIYGILHSPEYRMEYKNNLMKGLPRIPKLSENVKQDFVRIGKDLINLHLNYEEIPPYESVQIVFKKKDPSYKVNKIRFAKIRNDEGKLINDKTTIIFNKDITIENIPEQAYEYIINGRSAIEWIIDQYRIKTDKKSGITDDPNEYSNSEKYIFDLLLSIINVSVQTVDLVESLPKMDIIEE